MFEHQIVTFIVVNKIVLFDENNKSPSEEPWNPNYEINDKIKR